MLPPPLLRLPIELHRGIIDYLEFQDRASLAFTNHYFTSIIKPPTHQELLAAENSTWAVSRNLYACKDCLQFRTLRKFADDMRKGKRGRHEAEANTRFCVECGVRNGRYTRGTEVTIYGLLHVLCRICGTFTDRTGAKGTCASCTPTSMWTEKRRVSLRSDDPRDEHEDDWAYSTRSCAEGRHSEELYGVWPDA